VDYSRPAGFQRYGQAPQAAPPQQYAPYDKRASMVGPPNGQYPPQQLQRTESWGTNAPAAPPQQYMQQPSYPPPEAAPNQQPGQVPQAPQQTPLAAPSAPDSVGTTPTTDPTASYYFSNAQPGPQPPSQPAQQTALDSPYPNLQQSMHSYQPSPAETPASISAQPAQPAGQAQQGQQQHQQQQQPQQPYWQHSAAQQTQLPPVWQPQQQAPNPYSGYTQEAFPSAPQHAPKQPVVEEALIEL
jgi:growth factor-regulated tyrosine kinase substrate